MNKKMSTQETLSTLWIVVMFTMIYADILTFISPGMMKEWMEGNTEVKFMQPVFLILAILLQIPILMILLSRILNRKINRVFNIMASVITMLFIIGGGSNSLFYYFFASVEITCMLVIISISAKWKQG
jgi:hypothetical protein